MKGADIRLRGHRGTFIEIFFLPAHVEDVNAGLRPALGILSQPLKLVLCRHKADMAFNFRRLNIHWRRSRLLGPIFAEHL
jgi:hypothetical protein